jgi:RIO-like serine/threonine protein kinase
MPKRKIIPKEQQLKEWLEEIRAENKRKLDEILAMDDYQSYLGKKYYGEHKWRVTLWGNHPERTDAQKENSERQKLRMAGIEVKSPRTWLSRAVVQLDLDGNPIKKWDNPVEAAESFGKNKAAANQIVNSSRGLAITAYGYLWKFADDYENEDEC